MSRIVAGTYGGRRIATPVGDETRPTSDRVREAMFASLDSVHAIYGRRFLDLYAGSGAIGLEAASRGADHVLMVENDAKAARVIRENVALLQAFEVATVSGSAVSVLLAGGPIGGRYDCVFADPPYALPESSLTAMLAALVEHDWLEPDAMVVIERSKRSPEPAWVDGITPLRSRRYGETMLWYGRRS
ncbi:MAG TPA: 16S rRNA (guanine(966)-N(2))-methyltransferase RsmD [Micromonosporaceae bacterium]